MTDDVLGPKDRTLAAVADRWAKLASKLVAVAVDRAYAHATVALTETLRKTPDGRATLRKARQSRSYLAALADLDGLTNDLAGPSVASFAGLIRDAREDLYLEAFAAWLRLMPELVALPIGSKPEAARLNEMRGLVLHGTDLRKEVGVKVEEAKRGLLATLEMASRRAGVNPSRSDFLGGWMARSVESIGRAASMAIQDSMVVMDGIATVDACRPEYRPKNEFTP